MSTIKQIVVRAHRSPSQTQYFGKRHLCGIQRLYSQYQQPLDVIIEVDAATTNTPSGNKQLVVFVQESLDGTNYRSGPTSGTTTTDEPNLRLLGRSAACQFQHH